MTTSRERPGKPPTPTPTRRRTPAPVTGPVTARRTAAEDAFDRLHARWAPALVRQAEVLSGNPRLARRAAERAFDLAWQRWPEVAVDPDPGGWVRAAVYEYALAPRHRWVPWRRRRRTDDALHDAVLRLPRVNRRAVVLYDGLGLDLPEAAAELEATTAAAAGRILRARASLGDATVPAALRALCSGPASPGSVGAPLLRDRSERRARQRTVAAAALTALVAGAAALSLLTTTPDTPTARPAQPGPATGSAPVR